MSLSPDTLIRFEYIHCNKDEIERHEAAFDEQKFVDEINNALDLNLAINSFYVEITKNVGNSTEIYQVMVGVKGPYVDLDIIETGDSASGTTHRCIKMAIHQIREIKERLKH